MQMPTNLRTIKMLYNHTTNYDLAVNSTDTCY